MLFKKKIFQADITGFNKIQLKLNETDIHQSVREKLLETAYRQTPLALLANVVNALVLAFVEWEVVSHEIIAVWIILQLSIAMGRYYLYRSYSNTPHIYSSDKWERCFTAGILLSGMAWGSASAILFLTDDLVYQAFLAFVLAGMSAGAVVSLSYIAKAINIYLMLVLIPLFAALMLQESHMHYMIALMTFIFWIMIFVTSRRFHEHIYQTFKSHLEYENASEMLSMSEEHFETIFKEAPAGIFYYNTDLIVINTNDEMTQILQITRERMIGLDLKKLPDTSLYDALSAPFGDHKGYYEGPYTSMINKLKLWITIRTSPIYNAKREVIGGIAIVADITERVRAEEKITHQAFYDALTDIPNRVLLKDRIEQSLAHYRRHRNLIALMFLDLDHFKSINDSLGHHIGDALLVETANRLTAICREGDTVARLGGDEFVVLLNDLGSDSNVAATKAEAVAEKIHEALASPFQLDHIDAIVTSSSIGVAFVNSDTQTADDLLKYADTAMYQAKKEGRNTTRFYQEEMDQWIKKRLFLESGLRNAVKNNELELYYQPVIEIKTKKIIGAEALLRWNHPELGMVMPDSIIDIAEESGLIVPIGEWVLREACTQLVNWKKNHPKGDEIRRISINVSAVQFRKSDFAEKVISIIQESGIDPWTVELELTESMIIDKIDTVIEKMMRLREFGVKLSMDDFGTGYSSLAYLKRLPFTTLKIDRSFIRDIMSDRDDAALVETILSMASIFNLDVIAEGVETIEQFSFLDGHNCRYFQGYLCSKPVQVKTFEELLNYDIQSCQSKP